MAIQYWCKGCNAPVAQCGSLDTHKGEQSWRTDFLLGGRTGSRVRRFFRTKELAQAFESQMRTDFLRGKLMPKDLQLKLSFSRLGEIWYQKHILMRVKNPKAEKYHLDILCQFFKDKAIGQLKLSDGETFLQECVKKGQRPGYINRNLHTLKSMFNWAVRNEYITSNPFTHVKQLKSDEGRIRWLTKEEVNKLLETAGKLGDHSLIDVIRFGVMTGFRKGNLKRVDIRDIGNGFITAVKTKSGKPYDVPISESLQRLLSVLTKNHTTGPLLDTSNLEQRFRTVVKESGLWKGAYNPETPTLHTLRHTFASWYIMQGGDLFKLQKMLGHSSIHMTQRYAHLSQPVLAEEAKLLNFDIEPKLKLA